MRTTRAFIYAITLMYIFLFFIIIFNYFIEKRLVCICYVRFNFSLLAS